MRFPTLLSFATVLCLLLPSPAARAQWWLWDSPTGGNEPVDQHQPNTDTNYGLQGGHPLGQVFVPQQSQLYRIDFVGHNRYDERPVRFRLWRWNVNYATTKAGPILFEDLVVMPGPDVRQLLSVFPRAAGGTPLQVTPGAHYFFEFDAPSGSGDFAIYGSPTNMVPPTPDYYACPPPAASICDLRVNGFFQPPGDLHFTTYSTPSGAPPVQVCCKFSPNSPWTPPTAIEGQKTYASDYAWLVEQWADNQRWYFLNHVHKNCASNAFFEAFSYRKNGSITNAQNAVAMLEKAWQCRFAPPPDADLSCPDGANVDMIWMARPAYAYLWIQNVSPSIFTAEARGRAKQLFIDSARRFWPNRERGLLNRSFTGALTYKLISKIVVRGTDVPADEYDRWVAYADGVWNEFKTVWDTEEDSLGYNYLAWSYILQLAMEYGEDTTIWARPEFKALVERYYKHMSPLGIGPSFGDTNGINVRWVTMAWLFHKASAKWDDERYKWLGDRIFDYHRTHIKPTADGSPLALWQAVYTDERTAMAHAYFDVANAPDWTDPPENVREMPAAQQDQLSDAAVWRAKKVGQTFKPTHQVFAALAVKIKNRGNTTAGTIRLWKWLGSQSKTVASTNPVLYADTVSFTCPVPIPPGCPNWIDLAFEPLVHLNTADTYYFEISRSADFDLAGSANGVNPYAGGTIVVNGKTKTADAWFTSKTLSTDGSSVGYRRQATQRPSSRLRDSTDVNSPLYPSKYYDIGSASVPDKLVLRSGYDPGDLTFLVNVIGGFYGHAHQETAGIYAATDAGSVLLSGGSAYEDNLLQDTGVPIAKRHWGGTWQGLGNRTTIGDPAQPTLRGFGDFRKTTVAVVTWDDTFGWNLQQQRRFLFVKNRFLVVRDKTFFEGAMRASTGPIWHARDMTGDLSLTYRNWFDLFDREPQGLNGWRFYNPERYLFLYMSPRPGRDNTHEFIEYPIGNPKTPGFLAYQRWSGDALTNQSVWSDSVLIPHGPESLPEDVAARISPFTLSGTGSADAWAVRVETGPGEFWYVIDNPSGGLISASDPVILSTDARYAIVREKAGVPQHYVLTYDASSLTLGNIFSKSWGARSSVEMNGNVP